MSKYYDGTTLLSKLDLDGEKPEILICCGNRTAGKSYFWKRYLISTFVRAGKLIMPLVRYVDEVEDYMDGFMEDICGEECCVGVSLQTKSKGRGTYRVIYRGDDEKNIVGYITYLGAADRIKRISSRFVNVEVMFFDEFQTDTNTYIENEVANLISIHNSVARGHGKQSRFVPLIMCSNMSSRFNPYFTAFGIHKRLNKNTHFLRGNGWVAEIVFNENAATALRESRFNVAFKNQKYLDSATNNVFLNDSDDFIGKVPLAKMNYYISLEGETNCSIWIDNDHKFLYVSSSYNSSFPRKMHITNVGHSTESPYISGYSMLIPEWRRYYNLGMWRFENALTRNILIEILSIF